MPGLSGKQRKFLRGLGHSLRATIQVGKGGVTPTVIRQIQEGLEAHELVKVKVMQTCPLDKEACGQAIETATGAMLAQALGRTLLLYKPHPEKPVLKLPPAEPG